VILIENFEHDSLGGLAKRRETVSRRDTMALSNDRPANSAGKQSLLIDRKKGAAGQRYRRWTIRAFSISVTGSAIP
jgi:hypothetical protein